MLFVIDDLEWDGSHIGDYDSDIILNTVAHYPYNMYLIYISNLMIEPRWVSMHKSDSKYPCIIDEIKTIMGITKIGTHSLLIKRTLYILYNVLSYPKLLRDLDVNQIEGLYLSQLKVKVQDTFVFRMIVGLSSNQESSIILVNGCPSSYRNKIDLDEDKNPDISQIMVKKWFVDTIEDSIRRFIYPSERTFHMRQRIQVVINRIDKDLIWIDNFIMDRLLRIT